MEILSPVGNLSSLYAAARTGADAVYFGVGEFNARRNAENFTKDDLKTISSYCHIRGIKAYLALNTLVSDEEMNEALSIVKSACEAGIDAIIINDFGLASIVKKAAPNMPLHASTQMTVHNVEGVKFLKEKGYQRVVLARENSLDDMKKIADYANKNNIELEIFVSGAHCMSVSGQCLLSSILGCRSGNRGLCAQPCRLPFKVSGGNGYDLSLKDMNLFEHFDEFKKLNIASLKIEGRMKGDEYVAAATHSAYCYKNNLKEKEQSLEILQNVFSRSGFTDGYLTKNINKDMFGVRSETDIEKSKQIKNSIHELYRRERQSVNITMSAVFKEDKNAILIVSDGKNNITVTDEIPQKAQNKSATVEEIAEKLKKTGSTPYLVEKIDIDLDDGLFISGKMLSNLKNQALEQLSTMRGKIKPIAFYYEENKKTYDEIEVIPEKFILVHSLNQIPQNMIADLFFVPLSSDINAVERLIENGFNIGIKTPVFFNELPKEKLKNFYDIGVEYALMQNIGAYSTLNELGFTIVSAPSMNIFNSSTLENFPADYCTLSVELSEKQIKAINSDKPKGIYAYGKLPLMVFRNCPIKANSGCKNCNHKITDRKNIEFKIFCEDGVTRMINNRPIYLGDKPNVYKNLDFILLSFTDEDVSEVEQVITQFNKNLEYDKPYTRGLYFKGVL